MSDLKVVIKGKGKEFENDPEKVMREFGLLKEGEDLTPKAKGGAEPASGVKGVHLHSIFAEAEAG